MSYLPKISFWKPGGEKINYVNEEGFRRSDLLMKLGFNEWKHSETFGITDAEEIRRRQGAVKAMVEQPWLIRVINDLPPQFARIPTGGSEFLALFNGRKRHSLFWLATQKLVNAISQCQSASIEMKVLAQFIKETGHTLESKERQLMAQVALEVEKAARLDGIFEFSCTRKGSQDSVPDNFKVSGYRIHSYRLSKQLKEYGSILTAPIFKPIMKIVGLFDKFKIKQQNMPLAVCSADEALKEDLKKYLRSAFDQVIFSEFIDSDERANMKFSLRYTGEGLIIRLIGLEIIDHSELESCIYASNRPVFSRKQQRRLAEIDIAIAAGIRKIRQAERVIEMTAKLKEVVPGLFDDCSIASPKLDNKYKWHSLERLFADERFNGVYQEASAYRAWVSELVDQLRIAAGAATRMLNKSKEWGLPLAFPTILEDHHHLVSFESLYPIHLIRPEKNEKGEKIPNPLKPQDLVAFTALPKMNGQMVGLTGQNGGGKSATMEAVACLVYLAQSGLPVFGHNVSLNVKKVVGMVYNERGEGSTCELLLRKHKTLLDVMSKHEPNGVLLLLDEIGTGTGDQNGLEIGRNLLPRYAGSGCSVVFSTQIPDLAKFAVDNLKAVCLQFLPGHVIKPGIGIGDINHLLKEVGIH